MTEDLSGKWLELVPGNLPALSTLAVLSNPDSPLIAKLAKRLEVAARRTRRLTLRFIEVRTPDALESAFKQARAGGSGASSCCPIRDHQHREEITALAAKYRFPALYTIPDFMDSGGLMAYGVDSAVLFRRAADYVDKILKGARRATCPSSNQSVSARGESQDRASTWDHHSAVDTVASG